MLRRAAIIVVLTAAVAPYAAAQGTQLLLPGVTYDRNVVFTPHGVVVLHVITAPRPGGLYALTPVLARGTLTGGLEPVTQIERDVSATRDHGGDQRRLRPHRRSAERRVDRQRPARAAAAREPKLDRHRHRRDPARRPREALRHLAGNRPASNTDRAQPTPGAGTDRAVHVGFRPAHTGRRGRRGGGRRRLPADHAERRSRGRGHCDGVGRRRADPGRRCGGDGGRRGGCQAAGRGADRDDDPRPARPAADLGRRDRGARRRPVARPEREGGVPLARRLHERPGRRENRARCGRTARRRPHRPRCGRRWTTGLQLGADELRARPGARAARRRHRGRTGSRRRRHGSLRRPAPQPPERPHRARRQGGAARPVLRRLRAGAVTPAAHRRTGARLPSRSPTRSSAPRR